MHGIDGLCTLAAGIIAMRARATARAWILAAFNSRRKFRAPRPQQDLFHVGQDVCD